MIRYVFDGVLSMDDLNLCFRNLLDVQGHSLQSYQNGVLSN